MIGMGPVTRRTPPESLSPVPLWDSCTIKDGHNSIVQY